jgi:hypothetical protein
MMPNQKKTYYSNKKSSEEEKNSLNILLYLTTKSFFEEKNWTTVKKKCKHKIMNISFRLSSGQSTHEEKKSFLLPGVSFFYYGSNKKKIL